MGWGKWEGKEEWDIRFLSIADEDLDVVYAFFVECFLGRFGVFRGEFETGYMAVRADC